MGSVGEIKVPCKYGSNMQMKHLSQMKIQIYFYLRGSQCQRA